MPAVQEALRPLEVKEGVLETELGINERTRELFISDEIGERYIKVRGKIQWATLLTLIKHSVGSDTLGATNRQIEEAVRLVKADSCQPAANYVFNLRTVIDRNPKEPTIIMQTATARNPRYLLGADVILTEETRLIAKVQKKPKEEAKPKVLVDDRAARVLGEILLFKANWQYLGQALERHGVKIDEWEYRKLQSSHKIFTETMKSNGADNQALNSLTERIILDFASADDHQRKTIIGAQTSEYARFLLSLLEPLPQEELLEVFGEMRFKFVAKAWSL